MTIEESKLITVSGFEVEVIQKGIKNFHLGVYPPAGRVRVAAPIEMSLEAIRLAVIDRLGWVKRQKKQFNDQERQSERQFVDGESHYFLGRPYRLKIIDPVGAARARVAIRGRDIVELWMKDGSTREQREAVIEDWYREQLRKLATPLFEKWCSKLEIDIPSWSIRRMKTKWGTCNAEDRKIWLNLELAKKPSHCIEYVVIHELVHFDTRNHGDAFVNRMNQLMPRWQTVRAELNEKALGN